MESEELMSGRFEYDIFLSYSSKDREIVHALAERLKTGGLRIWLDAWAIRPGDSIPLKIQQGLEQSRILLMCMSPAYFASDWGALEHLTLIFRDPNNKQRRFMPLLISDCTRPDIISRFKYIDWRTQSEEAFKSLLIACKPEDTEATKPVGLVVQSKKGHEVVYIEQWHLADEEMRKNLPSGVRLVRTLRGHTDAIGGIAWSPNGLMLASPSLDKTIRLWDTMTGECLRTLIGHKGGVNSVGFDPEGRILASGSDDKTIKLWEPENGRLLRTMDGHNGTVYGVAFNPSGSILASGSGDQTVKLWDPISGKHLRTLKGHQNPVCSIAFDPTGHTLASGSDDKTIKLWDLTDGRLLRTLEGYQDLVLSVAFDPEGRILASGSADKTVKLWEPASNKLLCTLEGHTGSLQAISFSPDGQFLASKGDSIRLWRTDIGACVATIPEVASSTWSPGLAFHPNLPLLATVGSDPNIKKDQVIHIWELDLSILPSQVIEPSAHYINAKVVLVGDTGVGKTGLSLVLTGQPFKGTDSTAGRRVWTFDSQNVEVAGDITQTRETLLWDLAGQPGYRVIHQLHLDESAVALVVFDARSETDPLAGVQYWERALRLAQQRQGSSGVPMKKFLVSARNDRGGVSIGEERLQAILKDFGFDGYFKTSAKEGWQIEKLRKAIEQAIPWEYLPEVSSSQLFADIKSFLLDMKKTGQLLAPANQLYDEFARQHLDTAAKVANLKDQFETCISRLENRDLIRRLSFGGYVLLQPELLDAYASAIVNTAKDEPDGLGSLAEEIALAGKFFVPMEQRVTDLCQEQLLLHATVEELVRYDLALRENASDGRYLVFPSQFNRDYEDAPEPKGKAIVITFDGPVQSLYATLTVRLGHSGFFTTGRAEMWRNAAVFSAKAGGKCGLFLQEFAEARGRLTLFFDEYASPETRFHFEEFVLSHAKRHALDGTVKLVRFFLCPDCGDPVPNSYVMRLKDKGKKEFNCPCGGIVSLAEPKERIHFQSEVEAMNRSADRQRDFDAFVVSAKGETSTRSFQQWAGGERVTLAIVFTDVIGSTSLGVELRDEAMNEVRGAHFAQSRKLINQFKGREIKTIGDSFLMAFRSVDEAVGYARELQKNPGHPRLRVRAVIHIGPVQVEEDDVYGGTVNFAARMMIIAKDGIWLSDRAKEDLDRLGSAQYKKLRWESHDRSRLKGYIGMHRFWRLINDKEADLGPKSTE
jgi:WD40 repeat protein/class 3 adenylate cyclase